MKGRLFWTFVIVAVAALIGVTARLLRREAPAPLASQTPRIAPAAPSPGPLTSPVVATIPPPLPPAPASIEPAPLPAPATNPAPARAPVVVVPVPVERRPPVGIQDGKTIDFSGGQPSIIDTDKDKAALDKALKEMEDATKNVTFQPSTPPAEKK